jgi:proprotein convertase subtilisin/kexin type 5
VTQDFTRLAGLSPTLQSLLKSEVLLASQFFQNVLQIPAPNPLLNNTLPSGSVSCAPEINYTASDISYGFPNSDLHLFVTYTNDSTSNLLAYASACTLNALYRPNTGKVVFNLFYINSNYTLQSQFNDLFKVTVHEITHVAGFSSGLYQYYLDPTNGNLPFTTTNLSKIYGLSSLGAPVIKTPLVLAYTKSYYNCTTLEGMRLEDQGTNASYASHWERVSIANEYMTASSVGHEAPISNFTLLLLQDTGWYHVNFSYVD